MPSLPNSMQVLRETSNKLNSLTDRAADSIRKVEEFLSNECSIGTPCRVVPKDGGDELANSLPDIVVFYQRHGVKFRIMVDSNRTSSATPIKPWAECTQEIKLASMRLLPILLTKIASTLRTQIELAEKSLYEIDTYIGDTRQKGGK